MKYSSPFYDSDPNFQKANVRKCTKHQFKMTIIGKAKQKVVQQEVIKHV